MKPLNKIKYIEIKNELYNNSINPLSEISDDEVFSNIKTLNNAEVNDLTFFSNNKYLKELKNVKAKACLIEKKYANFLPKNCQPIIVNNPYLALAIINNLFSFKVKVSNGIISIKSEIDANAKIYKNVQIDSYSKIYDNTIIYDNVIIGSNSIIGPNVIIHKNTLIHDNVSISNSVIMEQCEIKSGARIGGSGFGFEEKTKTKIYHTGNVILKKNSTIGSNSTVDRAVFDSTQIGEFSQIDNLVQIAHNVVIGDHAIIAAQVGIAGSTIIGDKVKIGGQAGISGHLEIGHNVLIAAKSGVTKNIDDNKIVAGFPAQDIKLWKKEIINNRKKK